MFSLHKIHDLIKFWSLELSNHQCIKPLHVFNTKNYPCYLLQNILWHTPLVKTFFVSVPFPVTDMLPVSSLARSASFSNHADLRMTHGSQHHMRQKLASRITVHFRTTRLKEGSTRRTSRLAFLFCTRRITAQRAILASRRE